MTAASAAHYAFVPVPVEGSKAVHAEKVGQSKVHAAVATTHATSKHPSTASVKTTHLAAKAAPKATTHSSRNPLIDVVFSRLVSPKRRFQANLPVPGVFAPGQVSTAYGVTALGVANQGQGQTIGIVDEYHDPNIVADANTFSGQYGLQQFNVNGGPTLTLFEDTTLGPVPNSPIGGAGTSIETSLDVEWAHAMAPKANILLVEVPATGDIDSVFKELLHGVQYAASQGASVVSLSYGYSETNVSPPYQPFIDLPALYSLNQTYLSPAPVSNIAVTVSTGDYALPLFPASSPNVIGVGGTALHVTSAYSYETAWGGLFGDGAGGGGTTAIYAMPTFQSGNGIKNYNGHRTLPDVSLLADPATAVSVYDSFDTTSNGGNPWTAVGGTSLASPLFAGELAIVQQDRVAASKPLLSSAQINSAMYGLYNSPSYLTYFNDVTTGNNNDPADGYNGHNAATGYDLATGLGSPIANKLVPYLAAL